jgi:ubiquitin-protein ligase/stress response protein SCP2
MSNKQGPAVSPTSLVASEARKRLLKDHKEIKENPLENVTAAPLDDNLFVWHANVRGAHPPLSGASFHLVIEFKETYPVQPPSVSLCTPLPHPCVFPDTKKGQGYSISMDLLEQGQWEKELDKNVLYNGWSSAYSVLSILLQLQSFLLDANLQTSQHKVSLANSVSMAQKFTCSSCAHTPAKQWPALPTQQQLQVRASVKKISFKPKARSADSHMNYLLVPKVAKPVGVKPASVPNNATATAIPVVEPTNTKKKPPKPVVIEEPKWVQVISKRPRTMGVDVGDTSKGQQLSNSPVPVDAPKPKVKKAGFSLLRATIAPSPKVKKPKNKATPNQVDARPQVVAPVWKDKDYVAIMLQDAAEREQRLKEMARINKRSRRIPIDVPVPVVDNNIQKPKKMNKRAKLRAAAEAAAAAAGGKRRGGAKGATTKNTPLQQANGSSHKQGTNGKEGTKGVTEPAANGTTKQQGNGTAEQAAATSATEQVVSDASPKAQQAKKQPKNAVGKWTESKKPKSTSDVIVSSSVKKHVDTKHVDTPQKPTTATAVYVSPAQVLQSTRIDPAGMGNLGVFPFDILLLILSYLDLTDIAHMSSVARNLNVIAENGLLWKELFSRFYPRSILSAASLGDWKYVFLREVNHIVDELVCFHTRTSFEEDILGVPISFTVNPVTRQVDYISSTMDTLSYTAFKELNVRRTPYKETFSHWLPLYITEEHFQRALPHIKRMLVQLSPEYSSSTFDPRMALSALSKLMNTMIVLVMNNGIHSSEKALNGYCAFHRLLLAFIELYPNLLTLVNSGIKDFITNEDARLKKALPSLGNWIPLLSVSDRYTWAQVVKPLVAESMDRHVIWICKEYPKLANLDTTNNNAYSSTGIEKDRLEQSFEASQVSLKLVLFHVYFITRIARPKGVTLAKVADNYDRFYGRPNSKMQDEFQKAVKRITSVSAWPEFFKLIGLPCPTPAGLTAMLRESVRNSKKKKYHTDNTDFRNIQQSGTSVILKKGDNYNADKSLDKVVMGLGWNFKGEKWYILDATCFEFSNDGVELEAIDWRHTVNENKSITHSSDKVDREKETVEQEITIVLSKLRPETRTLVFTITAFTETLASAIMPWVRLSDTATNQELCRYVLENTGTNIAVIMCVMQKNPNNSWVVKVISKFDSGNYPSRYIPLRNNIWSHITKNV